MTVLAQTYLHLAVNPSPRQIVETSAYLQYLGANSANEHFRQEVELDFRIEQGSLKGWLTVVGGLSVALGNYGSLREGIDYAVKDSREFSEWIIKQFKSEVAMPPEALYRSERRLGVAGKIQRLYPLLEETTDLIAGRQKAEALKRLQQVQDQIQKITAEISESGQTKLLQEIEKIIPTQIRDRLPPPSAPLPAEIYFPNVAVRDDKKYTSRARPRELLSSFHEPPRPPRFD